MLYRFSDAFSLPAIKLLKSVTFPALTDSVNLPTPMDATGGSDDGGDDSEEWLAELLAYNRQVFWLCIQQGLYRQVFYEDPECPALSI